MTEGEHEISWNVDMMVEVSLRQPDDFLKVRETLTRIGVASRKEKKLFQSCHILHKKGIMQLRPIGSKKMFCTLKVPYSSL